MKKIVEKHLFFSCSITMGVVNTKEGSRRNGQDDLADLHTNTLNELQILEGHKDIVRLLVVLDNAR